MKLTRTSVLAASSLLIGGFMGASALVALAGWSNAPGTPPTCNDTTIPGCNAPINVGSILQSKTGWLGVNGLITNNLYVASGTISTSGSILTNDGAGNAKWATPTTAASQECGSDGRMGTVGDANINDWGTSGGGDTIEYYCRNHVIRICLGKEACTWRTTGITSDDSHTCGDNTHLKTGAAGYGNWAYAPASLCGGSSPCVQSNFNLGVGGKGQVMAYNKSTSEFYTCNASRQKGIIDETGQIVKGVAVQ